MMRSLPLNHLAAGILLALAGIALAADYPQVRPADPILPAASYPPSRPEERLVGVAYSTWHVTPDWKNAWGTPLLGFYASDDRRVIDQHIRWLAKADVDFIWVDWSNNIKYTFDPNHKNPTFDMIEGATDTLFEECARLRALGERTPNISIFAGVTGAPQATFDGRLQRKVDQIYAEFVANPRFATLVQHYLGKPLLVIYVNTPSPFQTGTPRWNDPRFSVRWMTGYVTQQPDLRTDDLVSRFGYWSWEDRGPQTFTVHDGVPESMVVVASYRPDGDKIPAGPRDGGKTFLAQWARARRVGPRIVTVVSWNEWSRGEQPSAGVSKDIEPSKEFGTHYLELLSQQVRLFKSGE
jgi:hypothetical protein